MIAVEKGMLAAYSANGYAATSWALETVEKNLVEDATRGIRQGAPATKDELLPARAAAKAGIAAAKENPR